MNWEAWVVLAIFLVNLVFLLIMSFVSPYYKQVLSRGQGKLFNIVWLSLLVGASAVLLFYNVQCSISGPTVGNDCKMYAVAIVLFLSVLTIFLMMWGIFNTIEYNRKHPMAAGKTTQEQKS